MPPSGQDPCAAAWSTCAAEMRALSESSRRLAQENREWAAAWRRMAERLEYLVPQNKPTEGAK